MGGQVIRMLGDQESRGEEMKAVEIMNSWKKGALCSSRELCRGGT